MGSGPLAAVTSIAGLGFGLAAKSQQASAEASADTFKSQQASLAAKYGQVQATQTDNFMRQRATTALAGISATNAAQGASTDSPTTAAIAARVQGQSDTERTQRLANINSQVASDQGAAAFYQQSARSALSAGSTGMLGMLAGGLGGAFQSLGLGGATENAIGSTSAFKFLDGGMS